MPFGNSPRGGGFFLQCEITPIIINFFSPLKWRQKSMKGQGDMPSSRIWSCILWWNKLTHLDYKVLRRGSPWQAINWHIIKTIQGRTHSGWKTFSWALSHCSEQQGKKKKGDTLKTTLWRQSLYHLVFTSCGKKKPTSFCAVQIPSHHKHSW